MRLTGGRRGARRRRHTRGYAALGSFWTAAFARLAAFRWRGQPGRRHRRSGQAPVPVPAIAATVTAIVVVAAAVVGANRMLSAHTAADAGDGPNPNCTLIVPANPLTAQGLATPYQLTATDPADGPCNEANNQQTAFVQGAVIDPATGKISVYDPLVIDAGTQPAQPPVVPVLPAGGIVAVWFGFNGGTLTLAGADQAVAGDPATGFGSGSLAPSSFAPAPSLVTPSPVTPSASPTATATPTASPPTASPSAPISPAPSTPAAEPSAPATPFTPATATMPPASSAPSSGGFAPATATVPAADPSAPASPFAPATATMPAARATQAALTREIHYGPGNPPGTQDGGQQDPQDTQGTFQNTQDTQGTQGTSQNTQGTQGTQGTSQGTLPAQQNPAFGPAASPVPDAILQQAACVAGEDIQGQFSSFTQVGACNAVAFFQAANAAIQAGKLKVPSPGTGKDGLPCLTTRSFALIDQDQSDNVTTQYLVSADGQTAQDTAVNRETLPGATALFNGSDNGLLDLFVDPAVGCSPWTAPDLANGGAPASALPLDELQAAAFAGTSATGGPAALVPLNDPMTLDGNGNFSEAKTDTYRLNVDQPALPAGESPQEYCADMEEIQPTRIQQDVNLLIGQPSPTPAMADNLFTFMAIRLQQSFVNLKCASFGMQNDVSTALDGNGIAVAACFVNQVAPVTAGAGNPAAGVRNCQSWGNGTGFGSPAAGTRFGSPPADTGGSPPAGSQGSGAGGSQGGGSQGGFADQRHWWW